MKTRHRSCPLLRLPLARSSLHSVHLSTLVNPFAEYSMQRRPACGHSQGWITQPLESHCPEWARVKYPGGLAVFFGADAKLGFLFGVGHLASPA